MRTKHLGPFLFTCMLLSLGLGIWSLWQSTALGQAAALEQRLKNPHGQADACSTCHVVNDANEFSDELINADSTALCESCHNGKHAKRDPHPVGWVVTRQLPESFPLDQGRLTCLTCHDVISQCQGRSSTLHLLRGKPVTKSEDFCAACHDADQNQRYNVHDQIQDDQFNTDTCAWCHVGQWDANTPAHETPVFLLRPYGRKLCENCHTMSPDHPTGGPHMNALPTQDMIWYMAAQEMRTKMRLPFKDLVQYVKAAKRLPRTLPLNDQSRITCYTCHNPHEKGVIRASSPRAIGADDQQARFHRLRANKGQLCQACHNI